MRFSQCQPKMSDQHKLMCFFYLLIILVVVISLELEMELFSSLTSVSTPENGTLEDQFVIVMDAGSTGTRMHIYHFLSDSSRPISLEEEFKQKTKPGLSAFTEEPKEIAQSLSELLMVAVEKIPMYKWNVTRLALIATAGLRTIPNDDANIILTTVREVFEESPFLFNNDSVYLITGKQEGLYAWYGLNFLLDQLKTAAETAALIDLGGESIQIAFAEDSLDIQSLKISELQNLLEKSTVLYIKSYLGIGLMDARLFLAQITTEPILIIDVVDHNGTVTFSSPCIHPDEKEFWEFGFKRKLVKNQSYKEYGYENCYPMAVKYLQNIIHKPVNIRKREIYALSSHVEHAYELGLIDNDGESRTVGEFVEACKYVCNYPILAKTFTCLDCCYISAFWKHGLGLNEEKEIKFTKNIQGIHVEWTLGAALRLLESK